MKFEIKIDACLNLSDKALVLTTAMNTKKKYTRDICFHMQNLLEAITVIDKINVLILDIIK